MKLGKTAKLLARKAMSSRLEIQIWEDGDKLIRRDIFEGEISDNSCPNEVDNLCAKIWLGWVVNWLEENHLANQMPLTQGR